MVQLLTSSSLDDSSELELSDSDRPPKNLDIADFFFYSVNRAKIYIINFTYHRKYHIPKNLSREKRQ